MFHIVYKTTKGRHRQRCNASHVGSQDGDPVHKPVLIEVRVGPRAARGTSPSPTSLCNMLGVKWCRWYGPLCRCKQNNNFYRRGTRFLTVRTLLIFEYWMNMFLLFILLFKSRGEHSCVCSHNARKARFIPRCGRVRIASNFARKMAGTQITRPDMRKPIS